MRQRVVHRKDICVVEDCYNAGPDSMKAAIHAFGSMQRPAKGACRKIFIMGDMLELGDYAPQAHYEAGQCAVREDIDIVICCGKHSVDAAKGAREACGRKKVYYFETKEEMADFLLPMIKKGWKRCSRACTNTFNAGFCEHQRKGLTYNNEFYRTFGDGGQRVSDYLGDRHVADSLSAQAAFRTDHFGYRPGLA